MTPSPPPGGETVPTGVARDIDEYISRAPDEMRATLEAVRQTIQSAAPTATESISYQMPTFNYRGKPLIYFGAWKKHLSLYPMSYAVIEAHKTELKGFTTVKGTIRFTPDHPLPAGLVKKFVKARIAEHESQRSPEPGASQAV